MPALGTKALLCWAGGGRFPGRAGKMVSKLLGSAAVQPLVPGGPLFRIQRYAAFWEVDGAAAQTGLIDVCGQEYEDMTQYVEETGRRLYDGVL